VYTLTLALGAPSGMLIEDEVKIFNYDNNCEVNKKKYTASYLHMGLSYIIYIKMLSESSLVLSLPTTVELTSRHISCCSQYGCIYHADC
jgi:hypothetical protein